MKIRKVPLRIFCCLSIISSMIGFLFQYGLQPSNVKAQSNTFFSYIPAVQKSYTLSDNDWPQIGRDPQRTNYSPQQVNPPYCYTWKWDAVPVASRAQPVVIGNIFIVGGMDGILYARNASTGAPIWQFSTGGPIRHSPGASSQLAITGSFDGYTYALNLSTGSQVWKTFTGSSATAPLIDEAHQKVYVASTNGTLTSLDLSTGKIQWNYSSGAPILTTPSLSADGTKVFFGNEAVKSLGLNANTGSLLWQTPLQGESLSDRYPVVSSDKLYIRSQPYYFFHYLLQQNGDDVMDSAGAISSDWDQDWSAVKPKILSFLNQNPSMQTFFVLDPNTGSNLGPVPVLYTYGNNDVPNVPVIDKNGQVFLTYRARHGIQTDGGAVHVSSKYDAELGKLTPSTLNITGLRNTTAYSIPLTGGPPFRMTSDEPAMLTMGGSILWVDNWERLGGVNVSSGALIHVGNVSNNWPECGSQCGSAGPNPFFPLSGNKNDPAYPFPGPRVTEGHARSGVVIANNMVYWHATEAGFAGISHSSSASCPAPKVWTDGGTNLQSFPTSPAQITTQENISLDTYVTRDMTNPSPITAANQDLVNRLRQEVRNFLSAANGQHLMPLFFERGYAVQSVWPYNSSQSSIPTISYMSHGNAVWQDPGELLYTMAMVYPYLDTTLQTDLRTYMNTEMARYSPIRDLPYNDTSHDWLKTGSKREYYQVTSTVRSSLNNWPPVSVNVSSIYAVWLWSKNTNDWTFANNNWSTIQNLFTNYFNATQTKIKYYADIAGAIGYYRLADHFGKTAEKSLALNASMTAMQTGLSFSTFLTQSKNDYLDPTGTGGTNTGLSLPVFYGMTPEVGQYLTDQMSGQAQSLITSIESLDSNGRGFLWWYLTKGGDHAESSETSFITPYTSWSHFMAHAYILHDSQATLRKWLDYSWAPGDLYSLQKIVATIQAP